ncbi:GNAT family N-acetyltransferase [Microvirga aerophila]|uniref:Acetyltransferase n=1 Tax=Microvirga aerophila TaxID=670291 RepID=A0A512BXL1_9HYPH|nr:GNAT family N-acetyltransferase [Microvirga aerophila]GEO16691.1 acetyltransferase [Microvirga aerophila]
MTLSPIIELVEEPGPALTQTILEGVRSYNRSLFPNHPDGKDLAIGIRDPDSQAFVGGLLGRMAGGWLAIELLFVPEALRGNGLATRLIAIAENEACERGCHAAWIDTLNPKARQLYERLGYVIFGELENYPVGSSRFFLQKALGPVPAI